MKFNLFACSFLFLSLFSCDMKEKENDRILDLAIDPDRSYPKLNSTVISDVVAIPLETVDSSLIKSIDKVVEFEDKIYVLDTDLMKLVIFTSKGEFIRSIYQYGKARNEYLQLKDFTIDKEKRTLNLSCFLTCKVITFDLDSYEYLSVLRLDDWIYEYVRVGDFHISYNRGVSQTQDKEKLRMFDENHRPTGKKFFPHLGRKGYIYSCDDHLSFYKDKLYYWERYTNHLYRIMKDSVDVVFRLGKDALPCLDCYVCDYQETSRYHIFQLRPGQGGISGMLFYDKLSKTSKLYSQSYKGSYSLGYCKIFQIDEDCAYSLSARSNIEVIEGLKRDVKKHPNGKHVAETKQLLAKLAHIRSDDNPILWKLVFKE